MKIIDGKELAKNLRAEIAAKTAQLKAEKGITPGLAVILVGENPASVSYVTAKEKACEEAGFYSRPIHLAATVGADSRPPHEIEDELLSTIAALNADPAIHGILVQLPLPKGVDEKKVIDAIAPEKDVDGFTPVNVGKITVQFSGGEQIIVAYPVMLLQIPQMPPSPYADMRRFILR